MASYVYPLVVPPGQSPPLAVVTPYDHRAWIYIAASLGLSTTLLSSAIRIFIRHSAAAGRGLDDAVLAVSTVVSFAQTAVVLTAGSYGLGSSNSINTKASLDKAQKLYYTSNLLFVLALGMSRQSVTFFLRRVTPVRLHKRALTLLLGVEAVWTLAFVLAMTLQCNLSHPWILAGTCTDGSLARWVAMGVTAALLEVAIFVMSIWVVVWNLHVAYSKRVTIAVAFGLRTVAVIVFTGLRLASFDKKGFASDPTLHEASFICWTQSEMNLSIIAATIPIAHRFLASLVTYYGGAGGRNLSQSEGATYRGPYRSTSLVKMASLLSSKSGKTARGEGNKVEEPPQEPYMRGAGQDVEYSVGVEHRDAIQEAARSDSLRMMIRKDVTYKIEYD